MTDSVPQKRSSKKRAPRCPDPSGTLALLAFAGTLKTQRLRRFKQAESLLASSVFFRQKLSANILLSTIDSDAQRDRMGFSKINTIIL
ncbi:MAG: hypothetical protein JRF02_01965 [Deltaproteobacteria bacterium]|jgi:hypothetical protein|nr:hypothetical protein [Deltaproteobacteria bacterium]